MQANWMRHRGNRIGKERWGREMGPAGRMPHDHVGILQRSVRACGRHGRGVVASSYRSRCRHYNTWPWSWGRGRWKGWKSKRNRARTEARGIRAGERRMAGIYPARWRRNFGFRKHAHVVSNEDWYLCRVLQGHGDRKRTAGQSEPASQHCIRKLRLNMEHPPSSAHTSIRIRQILSLGTALPHLSSASQFAGCGHPP